MTCCSIIGGLPHVKMVPGETLDWSRDWSAALDGETIIQSDWHVANGMTKGISAVNDAVTTQWVTATKRGSFALTNEITTDAIPSRVMKRTLIVDVVAKL